MRTTRRHPLMLAALVLVSVTAGVARSQSDLPLPLRLTAWAINMGNIGTGANADVDITIDRWSTEDERLTLITLNKQDNTVELENYSSERVRLKNVRVEKDK